MALYISLEEGSVMFGNMIGNYRGSNEFEPHLNFKQVFFSKSTHVLRSDLGLSVFKYKLLTCKLHVCDEV